MGWSGSPRQTRRPRKAHPCQDLAYPRARRRLSRPRTGRERQFPPVAKNPVDNPAGCADYRKARNDHRADGGPMRSVHRGLGGKSDKSVRSLTRPRHAIRRPSPRHHAIAANPLRNKSYGHTSRAAAATVADHRAIVRHVARQRTIVGLRRGRPELVLTSRQSSELQTEKTKDHQAPPADGTPSPAKKTNAEQSWHAKTPS